jgi:hypothetical protein
MLMDAKHHELFGNLCPTSELIKEWKETCCKGGVTLFKRESMGESILIRRADLIMKSSVERII